MKENIKTEKKMEQEKNFIVIQIYIYRKIIKISIYYESEYMNDKKMEKEKHFIKMQN